MKRISVASIIFIVTTFTQLFGQASTSVKVDSSNIDITLSKKIEALKDSILHLKPHRIIKYWDLKRSGRSAVSYLNKHYGKDGCDIVLALNRIDLKNSYRCYPFIVPDEMLPMLSYSPFPFVIDELKEIPKLLLLSKRIQAFAAYENGILVKWGTTSTGRKSKQTPSGLFGMNWKKLKVISSIDENWILPYYFNFANFDGAAFHQYELPGYPASHECVRLTEDNAKWIYGWADQWILTKDGSTILAYGTPLIIFDEYKFGKTPPWKYLSKDPNITTVSYETIKELLKKYYPVILERQNKRIALIKADTTRTAK